MCGIAGIIGRPDRHAVESMLKATRHRGPDDSGIMEDEFLTIGMNRLSIIDLSAAGHQPMQSDDGRYHIVFNGEAYNFAEVREKLKSKGHTFRSSTDTEVVLKAYLEYGENCLQFFRGMFAFIIYDSHTREVFGARDRFGVKPFYYSIINDKFLFASEIKGLLASGYIDFSIQSEAVRGLMLFGSVLPGQSIVKDIEILAPGHSFRFHQGKFTTKKYWELSAARPRSNVTYEEAQHLLREKLKESVELRFISDRPLGLFLSSGIDSASLLASAYLLGKNNVLTFTVGFVDDTSGVHDEAADASNLAHHLGFRNESILIDGKVFKDLFGDFVMAIDQPSIDGLNTFLITKYARQHLVVALSGLGGDELLNGYLRDRAVLDWSANTKFLPGQISQRLNYYGHRHQNSLKKLPLVSRLFNGVHPSDPVWNYFICRHIASIQKVSSLLNHGGFERSHWLEMFDKFDHFRLNGATSSSQVSYLELNTYMTPQLLRDMDAVSMYNSMEVRFPLIDHQVAELVFGFPDHFKINPASKIRQYKEGQHTYAGYGAKRILIDTFKEYLPSDYLLNKKRGFNLPIYSWLNRYFKDDILDTLSDQQTSNYFSSEGLQHMKDTYLRTHHVDNTLWIVFLFLKWEKQMREKFSGICR
ncbi:MAG: asparagine synthase (glutamine-hydrolyzing) [Bacteroidota bacterium]